MSEKENETNQCWTRHRKDGSPYVTCEGGRKEGDHGNPDLLPYPRKQHEDDHCRNIRDPLARDACYTMARLPGLMQEAARSGKGDGYIGEYIDGMADMHRNWQDMIDDATKNGDKYFHCKANCEASKRGPGGRDAAVAISGLREEVYGKLKGDSALDREEDYAANEYGRNHAGQPGTCKEICSPYRVNGINKDY
ncbi:MAG: hypothetical protein HQL64_05340 [Magnetococcales bacterium]|nr:hypothetical protein [Magnetococcales bacterium]